MPNGNPTPTPQTPGANLAGAASDPATQNSSGNAGSPTHSCGTPSATSAPPPLLADIAVHVKDPKGNPIQGVSVTVFGQGWSGTTDADGNFDFGERAANTYMVMGQKVGYGPKLASQQLPAPAGATTLYTLTLDKIQVVEIAEVVLIGIFATRQPIKGRKQYINLDGQVDPNQAHREYGRKITLQARVAWQGGSQFPLNGQTVYWYSKAGGGNKTGLTDAQRVSFDSAGSKSVRKSTTDTDDQGWTPTVDFFFSQYGGDTFDLFATENPAYSGGMQGGSYEVWKKFWYQVTEMKDGNGGVYTLPPDVTNPFEAGYKTVFIEFIEQLPRNEADHVEYLADGAARSNAAKPHFLADTLSPFKAHIMTVDWSQTGNQQKTYTATLAGAKWSSPYALLWRLGGGTFPWKVSLKYRLSAVPLAAAGPWLDIPDAAVSLKTHPTQRGFKQIQLDFSSGPVTPSPANLVDINLVVTEAGPNISLGWGGGSHHLFLCTGALQDVAVSADWNPTQRSDCVHEIGHALGLVNMAPTPAHAHDAWEDTAHSGHCIKTPTTCAMFWQSSTTRATTFHLDAGAGCHDHLRKQDYSRTVLAGQWKD